jgi:hypothetical protein
MTLLRSAIACSEAIQLIDITTLLHLLYTASSQRLYGKQQVSGASDMIAKYPQGLPSKKFARDLRCPSMRPAGSGITSAPRCAGCPS